MEVPLLHPKAPHVRKPLFLVTASAASSSRPGVRKSNLLLTDASPGCKEHMSMIRTSIQVCPRYSYYRHYHAAASKKVLFSIQNTSVSIQHETKESVESTSKGHPVSGDGIRRRFLEFYASRGHKVLPSASLVPDDPTVLLTIAGMLQFKPIFLGKAPRKVTRATTAQRCIRTNDVDNVGRTTRHQTFFEMLGNFSFGDYFKREAINWAWDLTTKEFGLPPERLWISVFEDDDESFSIWRDEVGVPVQQIKRMGEDDNFWTSGVTGPCGPCSEIYYDFHPEWGHSDVVCII